MDGIKYTEIMGPNVLDKLKYCGKDVRIYQLAKIINPQCACIDDNTLISDFVFIDAEPSFKIGKYCNVAWYCLIEGKAKIEIGDRVFLGPGSKILSSTYEFNGYYASEHLPKGACSTRFGDIKICDDAYIGANSIVMPGVTIGEGAIVGANSLVDHNLKPWGIYFGNPVKRIGTREQPTEECKKIIESIDWNKHF